MNLGFLTKDFKISRRKLAALLLLNSGTLAWFFLLVINLPDISAEMTLNSSLWRNIGPALFLGSAVFWSIVGSFIGGKVNRRKLLISSIALGTFSTILLTLSQGTVSAVITNLLMGMSLGLGLPSSMALIADYTVVEERARVSGTTILCTFILAFPAIIIIQILNLEIFGIVLLLALIRSIGFLALVPDKCSGQEQMPKEKTRLPSNAYKQLLLYLFPWVMFSIISSLAWNLFPPGYETATITGQMYRYAFIAVFGLVSGVIADRFGRKQPIIIGLIVLGISFSVLGFFGISETNVIIYLALSGIAWGSFFVLFLAVPGDLSVVGSREKFYGLGYILPIAVLFSFATLPGEHFLAGQSASSVSQIFSAILFLSIIPVLRAEETLHESKIQERKMKDYVEKLGKTIQKSEENEQT